MRIGYPCVNESLQCSAGQTFRLASYSPERLRATVGANLGCLRQILEFNLTHGLLFFRLPSGIVPFGSHPINQHDWATEFAPDFAEIGAYARRHGMRLSLHPDQFVVLNSPDADIVQRSVAELVYQGQLLDLLGYDSTAKLQIHAGGVYGDKPAALDRWVRTWEELLPDAVRARVVVEPDDRLYSLRDCLELHRRTNVPLLLDNLHHECLNHGEPFAEAALAAAATWHPARDGSPLMDYSQQAPDERRGKHRSTLDEAHFGAFIASLPPEIDPDVMLEIKDKDASAVRALAVVRAWGRT
ncbi:MAG: UV DNA damage repair endonuclease UvsE [Hymenobacteraceae bacterium]|nr:UV DNA damage repair endonuclease UvsE [Hymenobacteraceae bacterium]